MSNVQAATTPPALSKPLPVPDESSEGYWASTADHVLSISRCDHCGTYSHPPVVICGACLNTEPTFHWERVSGQGRVRSWTIMRDAFLPAFKADIPWLLVDVELDEQSELRTIGRLVDGPDARVKLHARVEVVFDDLVPGVSVPAFRLSTQGSPT